MFGSKEQGFVLMRIQPTQTDLDLTHLYLTNTPPPPPTPTVCSFCFQQPWLFFLPAHHLFLIVSLHQSSSLLPFLSPRFPAAVGLGWMVPTVQDPDLQSSDWLSQCPVVLLPESLHTRLHSYWVSFKTQHISSLSALSRPLTLMTQWTYYLLNSNGRH